MSDKGEQQVTPREVAHTAGRVARLLKTSHTTKKHGGYDHYKDDRIHIRLDTYVPNVDIAVTIDGNWHTVYSAAYHSIDRPSTYRPGKWVDYLFGELTERADQRQAAHDADREVRRETHERTHFSPSDDSGVEEA